MQEIKRRSQKERSDTMRAALVAAGRDLFIRNGFAATGTPDIVAAAGVTRGALYHHFQDKTDLFAAVVEAEAEAIAAEIDASGSIGLTPRETLIQGGEAFLAAMRSPGRARLMLVEAPAVLGVDRLARIDAATGGRTLELALQEVGIEAPGPLAALLSAAYDRAALAIDLGQPPGPWRAALNHLVRGAIR
ncbi:TetR/AcrR family transcriptional regulator [Tabrizicola aquatica]|uniref:TetR/AcrR family transcriptional regulator n=1 Tax=Tabrizicola aquatica TaxID=909926 RepID=UPI0015E17D18|nr:TetR/AcrR family transcriptional regulator [Tabrizicola aquatica]